MMRTGPRERIIELGADGLAADDLVAVVLGTGMIGESAVATARRVLEVVGGMAALSRARPSELMTIAGLGPARATRLVAAFALGRRALFAEQPPRPFLRSPCDVDQLMRPRLVGLGHEVFWAIAIDVKGAVIDLVEVGRGSLTAVDVHPREIFRFLIAARAAAGIVVHNHPSGDPQPSREDIELTQRLVLAGELLQLPILDHVVVATGGFRSVLPAGEDKKRDNSEV